MARSFDMGFSLLMARSSFLDFSGTMARSWMMAFSASNGSLSFFGFHRFCGSLTTHGFLSDDGSHGLYILDFLSDQQSVDLFECHRSNPNLEISFVQIVKVRRAQL
jgi:hypothetical protein